MRISILLRLSLGLGIAVFIFASALRASLEEILAPLPVADVATTTAPSVKRLDRVAPMGSFYRSSQQAAPQETSPRPSAEPIDAGFRADAILVADVHEALTERLQDHLRPQGELSLVPLRDLPDLSAYAHPFNLNLLSVPSRLSRGNILLRFQVENERGVLGEWNIPFRVHLYSDVWFPKAHLRRGDMATPSDFEIRQIDLLAEPEAVPAALELLLRHEYSRDITPGQPLQWKDLMERALVRKGDVVEVTAVNGLLAITLRAVARQDGNDGDLILLRNIDSAKEFSARVIGENRAEVVF